MKPNTLLNKLLKSVNENQTSSLQCGDILYLALYYEYVMDDLWLILNNGKYVHCSIREYDRWFWLIWRIRLFW